MICDTCLHADVCGVEGSFEESLTYCADYLGWIPVGKELPNVEQYALITVHNQTKMCWYQNGVFVDGEQNAYTKESKELVAWMPLPIPYEPQESEE